MVGTVEGDSLHMAASLVKGSPHISQITPLLVDLSIWLPLLPPLDNIDSQHVLEMVPRVCVQVSETSSLINVYLYLICRDHHQILSLKLQTVRSLLVCY